MTTIVAQVQFLFVALLLRSSLAQYSTYESGEEDEREESQPEDYSRYFSGASSSGIGGPGPTPGGGDSTGFVTPLDFTGIFTGANFALDGLAGGASQKVFSQPVSSLGFNPNTPTNSSGFVSNDINFRSLFDTSGSASQSGFRPSDFRPGSNAQATSQGAFFSPAFSTLKNDVDREVSYQSKESAAVEQSRASSRRQPVDDDEYESDEFNPSEYESEEQTDLDPNDRSPHKFIKQPYEEEREDRHNSDRKSTPYSTSNNYRKANPHYHYQSETRPLTRKLKQPLPTLSEEEDEDYQPKHYNKPSNSHNGKHSYPSVRPPSVVKSYDAKSRNHNQYKQPNKPQKPKTFYSSNQYQPSHNSGPPKAAGSPQYSQPRPKYSSLTPQSPRSYPNRPPPDFRPSPRDPYLDPHQSSPRDVIPVNPTYRQTSPDGIYPLPQTEYATVVRNTPGQLVAAATENKSCRKIQKHIDPKDFSRFKRQQMTCYICTDRDKGNKYEECSYESQPKGNSYYKGSAEAYSTETISPKKTFSTRSRRSVSILGTEKNIEVSSRVKRQDRYYPAQINERGHGNQHYRFGPQHFRKVNQRKQDPARNKQVKRDYDEEEYDEDEHDDDEDDVEKEYSPPGASDSDNCRRVQKDNGLTCMVCENPKSGGSYQQCSYASEPDENRYEYGRQSSYGTKRAKNDRYKRQTREQLANRGTRRHEEYARHARPQAHRMSDKRNDDFRDGKLKRKKVRETDYQKRPVRYSVSKSKHDKHQRKNDDRVVGLDPFFYGSPGKKYNPDDYDSKGKKIKRKVQKSKKEEDDGETSATSSEDYANDEEEEEEDDDPSYEESFYRLFPELIGTDPYTGERQDGKSDDHEEKSVENNFDHPQIPYEETEDGEESESIRSDSTVKPVYEYGADLPGYFSDDESKKDLEKALDEFTHKNRSECKKVLRDHMTCYQCLDSKGMKNEECMYVAASEPKKKHLAYHEVKEFKITPAKPENTQNKPEEGNENKSTETEKIPKRIPKLVENNPGFNTQRRRTQPTKIKDFETGQIEPSVQPVIAESMPDSEGQAAITYDILKTSPILKNPSLLKKTRKNPSENKKQMSKDFMITAESRTRSVLVRQEEDPSSSENKRDGDEDKPEDEEAREEITEEEDEKESPEKRPNYNPIPPDPEGFYDREGAEGAYTHETEPVFDSVLKITLPKYMLTKSEHEEIFDEVLRSG